MSDAKHTPGPWDVERHGVVTAMVSGHRRQVALSTGDAAMHAPSEQTMEAIQEANARLIAAAPELAEALEELLDWANAPLHEQGRENALKKARAALKKAGVR